MTAEPAEINLTLSHSQLATIRGQAEQGYPEEVCGILVGRPSGDGGHTVVRVVPTANDAVTDRTTRYAVPPPALLREQRQAREDGLELIGFYHSHPDHAARPSDHDRQLAWHWYSYVIVAVAAGKVVDTTAWRLAGDGSTFESQKLIVEMDA